MESRAKQRLTGAIILVALFVLLVPELLTGPRTTHPDAQVSGDEGMRSYTIDLDTQRAASNPMAPVPEPAVSLPPVPAPRNATPAPATTKSQPENVAATTTATRPAQQAAAQAPRTDVAQPATAAAKPPARPGSFVVQLGTFSKRENADRLVREMTAKGFAAFVAPTTSNGHELYRVRVGPTPDRASAEALAAELKRAGQSTSNVVPIT
jgi:DedD protein